ncbi:hypothetical protein [Roseibium marinum]|uniref:hypothetical protein n=1 Tax=Roseibium marinum TaxID=281252 RepID=UPI0011AF570A|nr:hypothetical protein [Roseibium marinum]
MTDSNIDPDAYEPNVTHELMDRLGERSFSDVGPLRSGDGGDGGMSDLVARVASLEAHTENIKTNIGEIRPDLKNVRERLPKLEEKVSHPPSKGYIFTVVMTAIALITAVIAYQDKIQTMLGLTVTSP